MERNLERDHSLQAPSCFARHSVQEDRLAWPRPAPSVPDSPPPTAPKHSLGQTPFCQGPHNTMGFDLKCLLVRREPWGILRTEGSVTALRGNSSSQIFVLLALELASHAGIYPAGLCWVKKQNNINHKREREGEGWVTGKRETVPSPLGLGAGAVSFWEACA